MELTIKLLKDIILPIILAIITALITARIETKKVRMSFENTTRQHRIEKEFTVLGKTYGLAAQALNDIGILFPPVDVLPGTVSSTYELFFERYKISSKSMISFSSTVLRNAPYIEPEVYELFVKLRGNMALLITRYYDDKLTGMDSLKITPEERFEINKLLKDCDSQLKEIQDSVRKIFDKKLGVGNVG